MTAVASANSTLSGVSNQPLTAEELSKINAYWRAANYLSVGQIYLYANPLLREPLKIEHVKPRLLGHWGTTPGLNFVYAHFNRLIKKYDLNVINITGPGHGGPGIVANTYLEGTYTELYPDIQHNEEGLQKLFKQFSFPGGIPSHAAPETPGSINEGGELGYSVAHAYGAVFDNPDLLACCVVGDGEAETGALATSWHSNKFLNPARDGVVLPILHLNGYKIANPTVLGRLSDEELTQLFNGYGYKPYFVEGHDPELMLEDWMKSYLPEELFDRTGKLRSEIAELAPQGDRRMGANPHANGGWLLKNLLMPDFCDYAVKVAKPGTELAEATRVLGTFLRDVMKLNLDAKNFRVFGPDETASNRLDALYEVTDKVLMEPLLSTDEHESTTGRVMEMLSEHMCQGWLEGYLLTGRHGFFSCYEAFIHIVDSMFNQHAKWLKVTRHIPWRRSIASLNYLLTSHVWRQDHNGFSHQDPGFIDFVMNKKADVVRVYLPPDTNTLLSVADHCLRSRDYINVIVAGKQPALQYLDMEAAIEHCTNGIGIWSWASTDQNCEPDVVMACAGDVPTLEALAAVDLLRQNFSDIKIRFVNVVDLMTLQPPSEHPHGISDRDFDSMFTTDKPVIFAYHGYPWLIHRLTYRRHNHDSFHVRGYKEEGTTTTPFDMTVLNEIDRYHLAGDVVDRVPRLQRVGAHFKQFLRNQLVEHKRYIHQHGDDMPAVRDWTWPY
jgi:xylulose-5-phosphate/fructose-6-phosphate phosphoketolase